MFRGYALTSTCLNTARHLTATSLLSHKSMLNGNFVSIKTNSSINLRETPTAATDILDESIMKSVFIDHLKLNSTSKDIVLLEYMYDFNNTSSILNKLLNPKKHILQSPSKKVKKYLNNLSEVPLNDIHMVQTMRWTSKNMINQSLLKKSSFFTKYNNMILFLGSTPVTFHRINAEFKTLITGNYFYNEILPKLDLVRASKKYDSEKDFKFDSPVLDLEDLDNTIEVYNLSGLDEMQPSSSVTNDVIEKNNFYTNAALKTLYSQATKVHSDDKLTEKIHKDPKPKYFFIDCTTAMKLIQKSNLSSNNASNLKYRSKFTMKLESVLDINPIASFISEECHFVDKSKKSQLNASAYKDYLKQEYPETLIFDNLSKEQMSSPNFNRKGPLTLFEIKTKPEVLALSVDEGIALHDLLDCISNKPSQSIATNLKFVPTDEMYRFLKLNTDWELYSNINCLEASQEQIWHLFEIYKKSIMFSNEMHDSYEDL